MSDALWVRSDSLEMEILPHLAGRVRGLFHRERNLLLGKDIHPENWGATFWTSPQSDWGWPPVTAIDGAAYEVLDASESLSLRSDTADFGGRRLRIEKHFRPGPNSTIDTEYVIENCGDSEFSMASWEISRVPPGGLTFFPTGQSELTPVAPHFEIATEKVAGTTFYDHTSFEVGKCRKLHADGSGGYLAHLMDELLLLKIFEDSPASAQAPGEGECEIFANDDGKYVEVEVQGPYEAIPPGQARSFVVKTAVVMLPQGLKRSDRQGLREWADETVAHHRGR